MQATRFLSEGEPIEPPPVEIAGGSRAIISKPLDAGLRCTLSETSLKCYAQARQEDGTYIDATETRVALYWTVASASTVNLLPNYSCAGTHDLIFSCSFSSAPALLEVTIYAADPSGKYSPYSQSAVITPPPTGPTNPPPPPPPPTFETGYLKNFFVYWDSGDLNAEVTASNKGSNALRAASFVAAVPYLPPPFEPICPSTPPPGTVPGFSAPNVCTETFPITTGLTGKVAVVVCIRDSMSAPVRTAAPYAVVDLDDDAAPIPHQKRGDPLVTTINTSCP